MSNSTSSSMTVKQVSFPQSLLDMAEKRISEIGIGFPEYIRHLVIKDIEDLLPVATLSKEDEESLDRSMDDIKHGRVKLMDASEIDTYFSELFQKSKRK